MKNHIKVNGNLLQTNKRFSQLKTEQQEKIIGWMYEEYAKMYAEKIPEKIKDTVILEAVYEKIKDSCIWIPYIEVKKKYISKKARFKKRMQKQVNE